MEIFCWIKVNLMQDNLFIYKTVNMDYTVPATTRIGHVHLKVSNLDKALAFYHDLLGFEITQRYGTNAVFYRPAAIIII